MRLLLLVGAAVLYTSTAQAQLLLRDDFAYTAGSDLTAVSTWVAHSGAGSNPVKVVARNLNINGYTSTGNAIAFKGGSGSREDVNRAFGVSATGDYYVSALVQVDSASAAGDYFFHLSDAAAASTVFRARTFIRAQNNGFQFGLTKSSASASAPATYSAETYTFAQPYLIVLRYSVVAGDGNDTVSLYVFKPGDNLQTLPATPTVTAADVSASDITPGTVMVRQGGESYGGTLDGIRISSTFAGLTTAAEADLVAHNARFSLVGAQPASEARVRLQVDVPGAVRVRAYDALGREVATLFDGTLTAGDAREVVLRGVPAGVYVVRAVGANLSASRTVVLQ